MHSELWTKLEVLRLQCVLDSPGKYFSCFLPQPLSFRSEPLGWDPAIKFLKDLQVIPFYRKFKKKWTNQLPAYQPHLDDLSIHVGQIVFHIRKLIAGSHCIRFVCLQAPQEQTSIYVGYLCGRNNLIFCIKMIFCNARCCLMMPDILWALGEHVLPIYQGAKSIARFKIQVVGKERHTAGISTKGSNV